MAEDLNYTESQFLAQSQEDEDINLLEILSTLKRRWIWYSSRAIPRLQTC